MSVRIAFVASLVLALAAGSLVAQETEQEIVDWYLQKTVAKHTQKIGWASINFSADRVNRNNGFNDFVIIESAKFSNNTFEWLDKAYAVGAEFGMVFENRLAWSIGGEYWLALNQSLPAGNTYLQLSTGTAVPADPQSTLKVFGMSTGLQYYLSNPPQASQALSGLSLRTGVSVGYYVANWDLWTEYENLNLATGSPANANTTFKGTAPGFTLDMGADYPLGWGDLALGMNASYLYLNFTNVAWYNGQDEEIIASLDGTEDGRVDLQLSGVRGKIELKRYFTW